MTSSKPDRIAEYLQGVKLKLAPEEVKEITKVGFSHHFRAFQVARFNSEDRT
jgi:diketogulonate reductase-like aldo/keto reductase